jgi:hypothetical protein
LQSKYCSRYDTFIRAKAPRVPPKSLFGNQLVTQVVFLHYLYGLPPRRVCQHLGLGMDAVFALLHRVALTLKGLAPRLLEEYRRTQVRYADQTGWRTGGRSGYECLFATPILSVFLLNSSRSARVARKALGEEPLGRPLSGPPLKW